MLQARMSFVSASITSLSLLQGKAFLFASTLFDFTDNFVLQDQSTACELRSLFTFGHRYKWVLSIFMLRTYNYYCKFTKCCGHLLIYYLLVQEKR